MPSNPLDTPRELEKKSIRTGYRRDEVVVRKNRTEKEEKLEKSIAIVENIIRCARRILARASKEIFIMSDLEAARYGHWAFFS